MQRALFPCSEHAYRGTTPTVTGIAASFGGGIAGTGHVQQAPGLQAGHARNRLSRASITHLAGAVDAVGGLCGAGAAGVAGAPAGARGFAHAPNAGSVVGAEAGPRGALLGRAGGEGVGSCVAVHLHRDGGWGQGGWGWCVCVGGGGGGQFRRLFLTWGWQCRLW